MSRLVSALAAGVAVLIAAGGAYYLSTGETGRPGPKAGREAAEAAGEAGARADRARMRAPSPEGVSNEPADPPARYVDLMRAPPLWSASGEAPPAVTPVAAPAGRPNVVLLIGCTIRKDQTSVYGAPANITPWLTAMAQGGAVFDDMISAAPWTRPASASILTGMYAVSIGMVEPGEGRDDRRIPDSVVTLGERMQARGYYTLGSTANPNLSPTFGFQQGYEDYQSNLGANWEKIRGNVIVRALLDTLRSNRAKGDTRPFYMRGLLIDAHAPRPTTGPRLDPYREDDVPERVAQYRFHLHEVDKAMEMLDRGLADMGYDASNTLFIFVSDHGEGMNYPRAHGYSHGQYMGPSTNHAVWVLRGPGVAQGQRIRGVASQVDLVPTLLSLIGAPLEDPASVEGRDWSALVRGEGNVTTYDHVWSDTWFQSTSRAAAFTPTRQCQDDFGSNAKQIEKGLFVPGCYDRVADPLYTTPIEEPALMDALHAWRADRTAHFATVEAAPAEVDPKLAEELRKLGYRE